jgi:hypothetical protein
MITRIRAESIIDVMRLASKPNSEYNIPKDVLEDIISVMRQHIKEEDARKKKKPKKNKYNADLYIKGMLMGMKNFLLGIRVKQEDRRAVEGVIVCLDLLISGRQSYVQFIRDGAYRDGADFERMAEYDTSQIKLYYDEVANKMIERKLRNAPILNQNGDEYDDREGYPVNSASAYEQVVQTVQE